MAVFEDFPQNSLLAGCQMAMDLGDRMLDDPSEWSYNYFVRLHPGSRSPDRDRGVEEGLRGDVPRRGE